MEERNFTHLHVHTEYSLLDGSAKIEELISRAKELDMDSVAITDHGAMYGVMEFYKKAKEMGIKPIIGCEVYVAPGSRFDKSANPNAVTYYHLVLLAENNEGYQNLIKIVSAGFIDGFYYKPRVDIEILRQYHQGIIALSACLAGPVAKTIIQSSYEKAVDMALLYQDIFGKGSFFLELQDHGIREQQIVNQALIRMNKEIGIDLVATNDSHYIYREDSMAHDILLCIQTGKTVKDENRMRYEGSEFYFKSKQEMYDLFPYAHEALENTHKIAERCNVEFVFHELKLPRFQVPDGYTAKEFLRITCMEGFEKRYSEKEREELKDRLEYELNVIETMGYVDYFLIVYDFVHYARQNGIAVGPGRGSGAGSIVVYCLGITQIDPIRYNLVFERFLNPERVSMPDIDIDFCYERRQEVIDYVIRKYGADKVSQIVTFGTLAARAAIKDVGRALDMPYAEVDKVSKMIPTELGITLKKALEINKELEELYEEDESVKKLIDMSIRLEGLPRHSSTHAAGVLICDKPVTEYVPLSVNDGVPVTQYSMTILEELGLLKMDFLGLRTLTVIQSALKEIKRRYNKDIDLLKVDDGDSKVYSIISQGKTAGIFQLESSGMKQFMKELQPQSMEDIIAGISLYRPGPMDFIPKYIYGKNNPNEIKYAHELLKPILENTYGCIVYQEQVMQIVRALGGYSQGRSDLVRRAMSKKKADVMAREQQIFIEGDGISVKGCVANGIPKDIAISIFDEMTDFAKYAFNKSHAAAYAVVAYQTAWLKTYYPVEFMAALMTSVIDFPAKVTEYIEECKKMGIQIIAPDINSGYSWFSVSDGKIVYALASIKAVGKAVINTLVEERENNGLFISMTDFCERVAFKDFNKRAIENLIKAGAFDSLGGNRRQYVSVYKQILDSFVQSKKSNIEGQLNLFDVGQVDKKISKNDDLPKIPEYDLKEKLSMEKEVIGLYLSGHPLSQYQEQLSKYITATSIECRQSEQGDTETAVDDNKLYDGQNISVGGIITDKTIKYTKNNKSMAFIKIEDLYGTIEIILFPDVYQRYSQIINQEAVIYIEGRVNLQDEADAKVIASKVQLYDELVSGKEKEKIEIIKRILSKYKGATEVIIFVSRSGEKLKAGNGLCVELNDGLIAELKSLLGDECVVAKKVNETAKLYLKV